MIRIRIVVTAGLLLLGGLVAATRGSSGESGVSRLPAGEQTTSRRGRRFHTRTTTTTAAPVAATPTTAPPVATTAAPVTTAAPTATTKATTAPTTAATAPPTSPATTRATTAPTTAPATSAPATTTPATTAPAPTSAPTTVATPLPAIQAGQWQRVTPPGIRLGTGPDDFGMQAMASSASDRRVVYVGSSYHGVWRTTDAGSTWTKVNTGENGPNLNTGRLWGMAVDPTNSNVVYVANGYGSGQGLWKSVNGGRDWQQMMSSQLLSQTTADIYSIAIDPTNANHVLVSFHGPWSGDRDAGLIESLDGGQTWRVIPPGAGWGWGHYVHFVDSNSWILGTQYDGHWRTDNSGASWTKITTQNMTHGGGGFFKAANGVMYLAANNVILRSTDAGYTWSSVTSSVQDGYYTIVSDGTRMYAQSSNTGSNTMTPDPAPISSAEGDGTTWAPLNGGAGPFPENGPFYAVYDPVNKIIMSSNWLAGVWRYKVP